MAACNHFKQGIAPYANDVHMPPNRIKELQELLDKRMGESLSLLTHVL
ncbi:hypothetical protein [Chromobacterium subtsugae]|nr:hypothetical protein [Chromobacterium subtsugae]